jgi:glycosyltransferase involved in cell wall biosynthesis
MNQIVGPRPRISVVIAARNEEEVIGDAIASVLAQRLDDVEIIVVDDRSTDRTAAVAAGFPEVTVLTNAGAACTGALNLGIRAASAPVIARLDADDVYLRGGLAALLDALEAHPEADLVAGAVITVDESGAGLDVDVPLPTTEHLRVMMMSSCPITHSAVAYRRSPVLSVGGYRDNSFPGEDYDLWERMLAAGSGMVGIERLTTLRLIRQSSVSALARTPHREVAEATRRRALDRWRGEYGSPLALWRHGRTLAGYPEPRRRRWAYQYQLFRLTTRAVSRHEFVFAITTLVAGVMLGPASMVRAVIERTTAHQRERVARGHPRWRAG